MLYDVFHSSQAPRSPGDPQVLGFLYNHGGLNNQKMAIAGLLLSAIESQRSVCLPYLYIRDQRIEDEYLARFQDVFELDAVAALGRRRDFMINYTDPSGDRGGWEYFSHFGTVIDKGVDRIPMEAALDALTSLQPRIAHSPILLRLKDFVFASLGVEVTIQLRIEHDWQAHAQHLRAALTDVEDHGIGFVEILSKVRKTFPDLRLAYVTADENSMPAAKDEIRSVSRARFGIDLLWKSDFLTRADIEQLNPLDLSLIDYEMAKYSPRFVGQTASSFANLLCLENFAKTRRDVTGHYIYNCLGDALAERRDNGFSFSAHKAVEPSRIWRIMAGGDVQ